MIKGKKSFLKFAMGILFCIICIVCLSVLICTLVYSFSEKARLEAIGAVVNLKLTWLFYADIAAVILFGIVGIKTIAANRGYKNRSLPDKKDDHTVYNSVINDVIPDKKIEKRKPDEKAAEGLHINYGAFSKTDDNKKTDKAAYIDDDSNTSSSDGGFFSSGGDL